MSVSTNPYSGTDPVKAELAAYLSTQKDIDVMLHFLGCPLVDAPNSLSEAAIVSLNLEWWEKEPHPTTEIGIAELHPVEQLPTTHAENILTEITVAHARIAENSHLLNRFHGAGKPDEFHFGTTKYVTMQEARQILVDTFCRLPADRKGKMQPMILLAHGADGKFNHIKEKMGFDVLGLSTVVKVLDTQRLAQQAGISGPKGPTISLEHLVDHFNINNHNLHTAGNDAAYTMITAVLASLKNHIYGQHLAKAFDPPPEIANGLHIAEVINKVMWVNRKNPPPSWGQLEYCSRCSGSDHLRNNCYAKVACEICKNSENPKVARAFKTHMTEKCLYHHYLPLPAAKPDQKIKGEYHNQA
jgi:hypothetical protein